MITKIDTDLEIFLWDCGCTTAEFINMPFKENIHSTVLFGNYKGDHVTSPFIKLQ